MDKIYIFDVDGTLTPSRRKMTKEFKEFFEKWALKNTFYLVTGSDLPKLQEQMNGMEIHSSGIFTCCGNQFWESNPAVHPKHCDLIYENKFEPPKDLIEYLKEQLEKSTYHHRAGNHIENRGSMLNFSVVGRDCSLMERENYFKWDNLNCERREISRTIGYRWPELDAVIGGQISIDIYSKGMDKSQILEHIENKEESFCPEKYIFVGDRTMEGGNDYPLARVMSDKSFREFYQTDGWEQTQKILEKLSD